MAAFSIRSLRFIERKGGHSAFPLIYAGQGRPGVFQLVDKLDPGGGIGLGGGAGPAVLKVAFADRVVHDAGPPVSRICRYPAG